MNIKKLRLFLICLVLLESTSIIAQEKETREHNVFCYELNLQSFNF